jgi:hypothetical protein
MAESVATQGSSFVQAYDGVLSAWRLMAKSAGLRIVGEIDTKDAKTHAAISSVIMASRLAQHVTTWEFAAVVSGDERETAGAGLSWRQVEREGDVEASGSCPEDSQEGSEFQGGSPARAGHDHGNRSSQGSARKSPRGS